MSVTGQMIDEAETRAEELRRKLGVARRVLMTVLDSMTVGGRAMPTQEELRRAIDETAVSPKVHILYQGMPRCRFSAALPRDWPDGHVWVSDADADRASCHECLRDAVVASEKKGR